MPAARLLPALLSLLLTGCIVWAPVNVGRPTGPAGVSEFVLKRSDDFISPGKVLVLSVDGVIESSASSSPLGTTRSTVADMATLLDVARRDDDVRAVVLRIDSPGGSVTGSDLVYRELLRFKEDTGRPVVACLMGTAASGGYYVAQAADEIWALPTTITGSIGVISQYTSVEGLMDLVGVQQRTIKSGANKDIGSPFREMSDEERLQLQTLVDSMHARFVDVVHAGRPGLEHEEVAALADGRLFTAEQALQAGLVDGIAYLDEVVERAAARAGLRDPDVVAYRMGWGVPGNVYAGLGATAAGSLPPGLAALEGPLLDLSPWVPPPGLRLSYLWQPGD